jgi:hypothetical protein
VERLGIIAELNRKKFEYLIEREKGLFYFSVKEKDRLGKNHPTFLRGIGATVEEALIDAWSRISTACEERHYRDFLT